MKLRGRDTPNPMRKLPHAGRGEEASMSETIGRRFQDETAIAHLDISDQKKGVAMPPLQVRLLDGREIELPRVDDAWGKVTLSSAVRSRRSLREYSAEPLSVGEFAALLWATQGVERVFEGKATFRNVPSAGARHAFETLVVVRHVDGLPPGLYQYLAMEHRLLAAGSFAVAPGDLAAACLGQKMIETAAATLVWVAVRERMTWRYGERGYRYLYLDAGHVCQNLYLACEAVGAGACAIGAYDDAAVNGLFHLDGVDRFVAYLASVGKKTVLA
jgi:SagB-type dehydrogenase family enzyme